MKNIALILVAGLFLSGCSQIGTGIREAIGLGTKDPTVVDNRLKEEREIPPPSSGAVTVAVYHFRDLTGQRRASQTVATLSSAVTQGADAYLVRTLQTVGNGRWFKVVERGGLDNLIKERQLIRQMRELYEGPQARPLPPMVFAGIIFEGGIIGYDSNIISGGAGARVLGIGGSTEYRQDEVVVNLRAVSVATGEVLASVTVSKVVVSWQDKISVLRFNDAGTQALELETGGAVNESMNKAVQLAILGAVTEIIFEGEKRGVWQFGPTPQRQ